MKDILILCPVRGRAGNDIRLLETWSKKTEGLSEVLFVCDDDDETPRNYECKVTIPRKNVPLKTNTAIELYPDYRFYMFVGDDVVFTQQWESQFISSCKHPASMVWAYDGAQYQHLPCHPMLSGNLVKALGWFFYPKLQHLYVDNVLLDIVRYLGYELGVGDQLWTWERDILIEHLHADFNKAPNDELYQSVDGLWAKDKHTYHQTWLKNDLWPTIRRLKEVFKLQ